MPDRLRRLLDLRVLLLIAVAGTGQAQTCYAPERPFVPTDPHDMQEYRDLIGRDFETYITGIQSYFRCLDEERVRAFEEARDVSQAYGRFLEIVGDWRDSSGVLDGENRVP